MKKYEYTILEYMNGKLEDIEVEMNKLGEEGWELVSASCYDVSDEYCIDVEYKLFFKREKE